MMQFPILSAGILGSLRKAVAGEERLSIAWWGWGAFAQIAYVALYIAEDHLRLTDDLGADLLDGFKLILLCAWATMAWRCSKNTDASAWTVAARAALTVTLVTAAITL